MIHPLPSKRSAILTGMIAAATLFISVDAAQAGPAEQKALLAELQEIRPNADLSNATPDELAIAVREAIANNAKFKPGVVAGEALKSTAGTATSETSDGAGDEIGEELISIFTTPGTTTVDRPALIRAVGDAAKTAGTSKGGNVTQIGNLTETALNPNEAAAAALFASSSKTGVGAIFGGAANELDTDAARIDLVKGALSDKKLAGAALDISRSVAQVTENSAAFALEVAKANTKLALNIVTGAAAGDTTNAGAIVAGVTTSDVAGLRQVVLKGASKLAKSVGTVADIEQVVLVGKALAEAIGTNATGLNGKPVLKASAAVGLTKTLTKAILAKPVTSNPTSTAVNKADEIAEVAAFIAGGIIGSSGVTDKTAPKLFLAIIKAAVAGGKASKKQVSLALGTDYIADIAGSVALTVQNNTALSPAVKSTIQALLLKSAKSIGGTSSAAVTLAIEQGFRGGDGTEDAAEDGTGDQSSRFEDGNQDFLAVAEPETNSQDIDIRPFRTASNN